MRRQASQNPYLIPFIIAVILHAILLAVMMNHWSEESPRQVGLNSTVQIISAVALSEATRSTAVPPKIIKPVEKKPEVKVAPPVKPVPEKKAPNPSEPPVKAKPQQTPPPKKETVKTPPKKALAVIKENALKQKQEKLKQQKIAEQKAKELQKELMAKQLAAEQRRLKLQQQKEAAQAKALQQKLLQQQLASEERKLQAAEQEQHQALQLQGVLDEYKSQIIAAISQYWIVPPETVPNIYCRLLIHLAPTGSVLKVEMLHSSGDPILDRSAKEAVMKASPLPVPKEARLFDNFRELRLSFRPEGVVQG